MISVELDKPIKRPPGRPRGRKTYDPIVGMRFPPSLVREAKDAAARKETSLSDLVRVAVVEYLDRLEERAA
jgi:predicted HicB family RNase H-like nuclease